MDRGKLRLILIGVSVASIVVTILGLCFGFPFFACFLFLPGLIGIGGFGNDRNEKGDTGRYCPGCGSPVDPGDSFCRVCGRYL